MFLIQLESKSPPKIATQFKMVDCFMYLRVQIVPQLQNIVASNYEPLLQEISKLLERRTPIPSSLIGKINILKMNILPRLLYLFENLPLPPPSNLFTQLKRLFVRFLWNNRRPWIRLSLLYLPYDRGGLKCPSPLQYYWAVELKTLLFYFTERDAPPWKEMEKLQLSLSLPAYLYSARTKILKNTKNPIVKNMIVVWLQVKKDLREMPSLSVFCPIWRNNSFPPSKTDGRFKSWANEGLEKIGGLYNSLNTYSSEMLLEKTKIKHYASLKCRPQKK